MCLCVDLLCRPSMCLSFSSKDQKFRVIDVRANVLTTVCLFPDGGFKLTLFKPRHGIEATGAQRHETVVPTVGNVTF